LARRGNDVSAGGDRGPFDSAIASDAGVDLRSCNRRLPRRLLREHERIHLVAIRHLVCLQGRAELDHDVIDILANDLGNLAIKLFTGS
jgi:hypothetical protein